MTHQKVTNKLPTGCQQVTNCQPTVGKNFCLKHNKSCWRTVGQLSADYWPITGQLSTDYWPTVGRQTAYSQLIAGQQYFSKLSFTFTQNCITLRKQFLNHRTPSLTRVFSNCYEKKTEKEKERKKQKKKQQVSRPQSHPLEFQIIILAVLVSLQLVSLATQLLFHLYLNHKFSLSDIIPTQV